MRVFISNKTNGEAGFNVIELAVVVMIAGIVTAMSVVMFGKGKARYQLTNKVQSISWQIERARSLAVKYNQTLTLGFTSQNSVFGLTCAGCTEPRSELAPLQIPADITLSSYPIITIRGNGTISSASGTIMISDAQGRQIPITLAHSGRTIVGDLSEGSSTH